MLCLTEFEKLNSTLLFVMTPSELEKLRADPSVIWLERDKYRLQGDPSWMTRRVPLILRPEPEKKKEGEMANYKGSPEYQAMLKRNGGVAPGGKRIRTSPSVRIGPRGGKYTQGWTKDGRPYRRYF